MTPRSTACLALLEGNALLGHLVAYNQSHGKLTQKLSTYLVKAHRRLGYASVQGESVARFPLPEQHGERRAAVPTTYLVRVTRRSGKSNLPGILLLFLVV